MIAGTYFNLYGICCLPRVTDILERASHLFGGLAGPNLEPMLALLPVPVCTERPRPNGRKRR